MPKKTANQLSDGDSVHLSMETRNAWGHVAGLSILDASEAPEFCFEKLLSVIEERIKLVPRFTWKLQEVPFALDRPYWVDCPEFDIRKHVLRIGVPSPGGLEELGELAGKLNTSPLRRNRPLWEMWYIEGVQGGKAAMFMKSHHCLMDGQAGAGLSEVLCDLAPDSTAPPLIPEAVREAHPRAPESSELTLNFLRNTIEHSRKTTGHLGGAVRNAFTSRFRAKDEFEPPAMGDAPRLFFNGAVGDRRGLACASLDLEEMKQVKKHFGVTLNDVVLELVGAALRRWLLERGELPEAPLVAICPISLRKEGDQSLDNQVTTVSLSLATDVEDADDRLRRIHLNAKRGKEVVEEDNLDFLTVMSQSLWPASINLMMRAMERTVDDVPLVGNLVVSNVRGTPVPLYTAGARIESMYPMSILQHGQALNLTVVSYMGKVDFGFTYEPDIVEDAWALAAQVRPALEELLEATRTSQGRVS
ncbi:MAG: wax ester/triacylglycerol synthase family O-acyltransferase [Deltaproteobacteria bacterium]|nr:wax ester/triacylglycerol synthase family O-acyltransferase [Deltaproteobacteria bacterium]